MKDNARHVPGSTWSCRTPLSRSAAPLWRFRGVPKKSVQNPYKSDHFREYEFFIASVLTTYDFNALKCTDFRAVGASRLPRGEGQSDGQIGSLSLPRISSGSRPSSLDSRRRSWRALPLYSRQRNNLLAIYCTEPNTSE